MQNAVNNIEKNWKEILHEELNASYFQQIITFIESEKKAGKIIYPESKNIFNAINKTAFDSIKIVIIGQDPYHGFGQAHGLSFSVLPSVKIPPSLKNIYKELFSEFDIVPASHGCLENWATQGVLLLNSCLSVEESKPNSHAKIGWEHFTDAIISKINDQKSGIVFLLWGKFAQEKSKIIDVQKHFILQTAHPSPFSAYNGFLGCKHFSHANYLLTQQGKTPINWEVEKVNLTLF